MTSRLGMSTAYVAPAPSLFIASPRRDFLFFFLSVTAVLIAWLCAAVLHVHGFYILAAVAVVSNGPHLISTWTRVYFDPREWKGRPFLLIGVPLLIASFVVFAKVFLGVTGTRILNSAILYWATWHFVAQNWGILRIYQRKSGEPESSLAMRLEKPMLLVFVLWCLLHRIYTGPRMLFGVEIFYVPLPGALVDGLLGPLACLLAIYVVQRIRQRKQPWARASYLRAAFLGCAVIGFFVPFRFITTDDTSAFAAAACWHGFQYLGIVRHYHRTAWKNGVDPDARIVSWLAQPGYLRGALYFAFLLALAGAVYGVIYLGAFITRDNGWDAYTWGAVIWVSLTLSHYWVDGVIWKLRRPELAARVGI
jgi:hypothetical protein